MIVKIPTLLLPFKISFDMLENILMFFKKKRKYPLPKFPPHVASIFRSLCILLDDSELGILLNAVNEHFKRAKLERHPESNYNQQDANEIMECCKYLLENYSQYSDKHKELIIGAVRYAASSDDPFCDNTFASGLSDDKQVLNHVLEELGLHDRYLYLY